MSELYVGLMSGTSLDGIDAALVDFVAPPGRLVASHFVPYPDAVRAQALALNAPGADELERAAELANQLADLYARATPSCSHGPVRATRPSPRSAATARRCGIARSAATRFSSGTQHF